MERNADRGQEKGFVKVALGKVNVLTLSGIDEASASIFVNDAVGCQGAYNDAVSSCSTCGKNIVDDNVQLSFGVKEVTASRTNQNVLLWPFDLHGGLNQTDRRRKATFVKAGAELDAPCPTLCGVEHGRNRAGADFERFHSLLTLCNQ